MRYLIAALIACLLCLPVWGQSGSRDFEKTSGTARVEVGSSWTHSAVGITDEITIAAWIKAESWASGFAWNIAARDEASGSQRDWIAQADDGSDGPQWVLWNSSDSIGIHGSTSRLSLDTWHFLTFTYDSSNMNIYVNGTLVAGPESQTGNINDEVTGVYFGNSQDKLHDADGLIAYVHIYNRAISTGEMSEIMYCPGSVTSGLVGYWPLTDYSTQYDLSIYSYNGTNSATESSTDGPPIMQCGNGGN